MNKEKLEKILEEIRKKGIKCEYDFLLQLYLLLRFKNFPILLTELNAFSGYSLRFLYDYNKPYLFNESIPYISANLKKYLDIDLLLSRTDDKDSLPEIPFILYPKNLLFIGNAAEEAQVYRDVFYETENIEELLKNNSFTISAKLTEIPQRNYFYKKENLPYFIELMEKEFSTKKVNIKNKEIFSGKAAYDKFAEDLRNPSLSFTNPTGNVHPYLSYAVYPQWTSINGIVTYLLGIHYFLDKKAQKQMSIAVRHFEDVLLFWREWSRNVGREAFLPSAKSPSMKNRRRAANALNKAADAYSRGIESLHTIRKLI